MSEERSKDLETVKKEKEELAAQVGQYLKNQKMLIEALERVKKDRDFWREYGVGAKHQVGVLWDRIEELEKYKADLELIWKKQREADRAKTEGLE